MGLIEVLLLFYTVIIREQNNPVISKGAESELYTQYYSGAREIRDSKLG